VENKTINSSKFTVEFTKHLLKQAKKCFLQNEKRNFTLIWHGGEPLLWGINNYKSIFEFMEKEFEGYNYQNNIQTNLLLINEDIIGLFKKYNVKVGFSLDGIREINDIQRIDKHGNGTFDLIMDKFALCKNNKLELGCIVVATKKHIGKVKELYNFMSENNIGFKLNPIFNSGEAKENIDEYGLTPSEYADMSIELFDLWYFDTKHKNNNSIFVDIASNLATKKITGCLFEENCQNSFLGISPYGNVLPCGRFCDEEEIKYSYGNLHMENLDTILSRINESEMYKRFEYIKESDCKYCEYFYACHGGCLHDGYLKSGDFKSKTFLCSAYKKIFPHILKRLKEVNISANNL
jgi:uncharacterized protein